MTADNLVELTAAGTEQVWRAFACTTSKVFSLASRQAVLTFLRLDVIQQSVKAGERISSIIGPHRRCHLYVSPFQRTLQTARNIRRAFSRQIDHTYVESRIREQEFGNLQGSDFTTFRKEQNHVGRFWYRFPTGESGADVYDRVKSWWSEGVLGVNTRAGVPPVDALVVVTHGLTMRFVLMQLYGWSPTTFHSVWNAENCDVYVLRKDLSRPGASPYVVDASAGDTPKSSTELLVTFKPGASYPSRLKSAATSPVESTVRRTSKSPVRSAVGAQATRGGATRSPKGAAEVTKEASAIARNPASHLLSRGTSHADADDEVRSAGGPLPHRPSAVPLSSVPGTPPPGGQTLLMVLQDYLSVPAPRTTQKQLVKRMLAEQNPGLDPEEIADICFHAGRFKKYR